MGSSQADAEEKQEMDDSGCIQDECPPVKQCDYGSARGIQLLDLPDDVLLHILQFLSPRDLRALGYCCPRMGSLAMDRSLWQHVDAREHPWTHAQLRWYMLHALHAGTRSLLLSGYAREAKECLGHVNQTREQIEAVKVAGVEPSGDNNTEQQNVDVGGRASGAFQPSRIIPVPSLGPNAQLYIDESRNVREKLWAWPRASDPLVSDASCPGPQFTLSLCVLRLLARTCPLLSSLHLEYCNINCNVTAINHFPGTLRELSLRGSKCYNLQLDRSFLSRIQCTLGHLEILDVSECEWLEPSSLLPLSKLASLKRLFARDCLRLTEFVAYASLATRYGFRALEWLDLRGSPVGDSEVSALGWLPCLTHLWLCAMRPPAPPTRPPHSHHKHDALPSVANGPGERWEHEEPLYYKIKEPVDCSELHKKYSEICDDQDYKHTWRPRDAKTGRRNSNTTECPSTPSAPSSSVPSTSKPSTPSGQTKAPSKGHNSKGPPKEAIAVPSNNSQNIVKSSSESSHANLMGSDSHATETDQSNSQTTKGNLKESNGTHPNGPGTAKASPEGPSNGSSPRAPKRKRSPSPSDPSKRKRDDSSSDDDDYDVPLKSVVSKTSVNEGASTSRGEPKVKPEEPEDEDFEVEPSHHILYVNVGQQLHAVYRLSLGNDHMITFSRNNAHDFSHHLSQPATHIEATSLITDSAIRRFGRADGEDINYIHIGPNGPYPGKCGARPDRSSLTHLSVTGFRHITDRSLDHLATSAPNLQFLDFSGTSVTSEGVAAFRIVRPDCELVHSRFNDDDEDI